MTPYLAALNGGSDLVVGRIPILVGRHPLCDVQLDSVRVSRRHCYLVECDGEILVRDLGSTNGTRVNGQRVESGWLGPGDELEIAHFRFRVEDGWARLATRRDLPRESADVPGSCW
jgi:pSer/pThr/pTyr-binding forkhead associated (FHA) protein